MASSEQPVAETANTVNIDVSAYEQQIQALQQRASEAEEKFQGIKGKLDDAVSYTHLTLPTICSV